MSDIKKQITPENAKEYRKILVECYELEKRRRQAEAEERQAADALEKAQIEAGHATIEAEAARSHMNSALKELRKYGSSKRIATIIDGMIFLTEDREGLANPIRGPFVMLDDVRVVPARFVECVTEYLTEMSFSCKGTVAEQAAKEAREIDLRFELAKYIKQLNHEQRDMSFEELKKQS